MPLFCTFKCRNTGAGGELLPEAVAEAGALYGRRAFGDRQQPVRAVAEAVCDRTKELAVREHAARRAGKRHCL